MTVFARIFAALFILIFAGLHQIKAEEIDVREAITPSGLEFTYIHSSAQDLVVVSFAFPGGTAHDLLEGPQTSFIVANVMMQSAGGVGFGAFKEDIQDYQAAVVFVAN